MFWFVQKANLIGHSFRRTYVKHTTTRLIVRWAFVAKLKKDFILFSVINRKQTRPRNNRPYPKYLLCIDMIAVEDSIQKI